MRRILLVMSVAALMVAMMLAMAVPAFAAKGGNGGGAEVAKDFECRIVSGTASGIPGTCTSVVTPSGNINVSFHERPPK